jgi:hypothetical protein
MPVAYSLAIQAIALFGGLVAEGDDVTFEIEKVEFGNSSSTVGVYKDLRDDVQGLLNNVPRWLRGSGLAPDSDGDADFALRGLEFDANRNLRPAVEGGFYCGKVETSIAGGYYENYVLDGAQVNEVAERMVNDLLWSSLFDPDSGPVGYIDILKIKRLGTSGFEVEVKPNRVALIRGPNFCYEVVQHMGNCQYDGKGLYLNVKKLKNNGGTVTFTLAEYAPADEAPRPLDKLILDKLIKEWNVHLQPFMLRMRPPRQASAYQKRGDAGSNY